MFSVTLSSAAYLYLVFRKDFNIKPELYDLWLSSLINTARTFDKHWDVEVEISWNLVLGQVIRYMLRYY